MHKILTKEIFFRSSFSDSGISSFTMIYEPSTLISIVKTFYLLNTFPFLSWYKWMP